MNRAEIPTTIKMGLSPRPEFDPRTPVPPERLVEVSNQLQTSTDRQIDNMLLGVEERVIFTQRDWLNIRAALKVNNSSGVILHPDVWRGLKVVKAKHKAKRRARARMRSRGYVAHGRHQRSH